jgi:glucose-6-phosphate isomerase
LAVKLYDSFNIGIDPELDKKIKTIKKKKPPLFATKSANLGEIKQKAFAYTPYKNIIMIGYGGSVTSFKAIHDALREHTSNKKIFVLDTVDPDYFKEVMQQCPKNDTLVIAISKSGNTLGVIQSLFFFQEYKIITITSEDEEDNGLFAIAKKRKLPNFPHPNIGGRFSARTSTLFLPAFLLGYDIEAIEYGLQTSYSKYHEQVPITKNLALYTAAKLNTFEKRGFNTLYFPLYSKKLNGFMELITQLIHESCCKNEKGFTVLTSIGPEAQHHTNQRLFGGKKDMISIFLKNELYNEDKNILVPLDLVNQKVKDLKLSAFEGLSYGNCLTYELYGSYQECINQKIPSALITFKKIEEFELGQLIGFFQYLAIYLSYLNDVDPFDQPAVEASKKMTFSYIKKYGYTS